MMVFKLALRRVGAGLSVLVVLCLAPVGARADLAQAIWRFTHDLKVTFNPSNFTNTYYTSFFPNPGPGSGFLTSHVDHASPDDSKSFGPDAPWDKSTTKTGPGESTDQHIHYDANVDAELGNSIRIVSDSRANASAAFIATPPDLRHARSDSITDLTQAVDLNRVGANTAPVQQFKMTVDCPAGTVHMDAMHEGNALGHAGVFVDLRGKLIDNATGIAPMDLDSRYLISGVIDSNATWDSPNASGDYFFDLPDWTRLPNASFTIKASLHMFVVADAKAVPEPGSFLAVGTGLVCFCAWRRRK